MLRHLAQLLLVGQQELAHIALYQALFGNIREERIPLAKTPWPIMTANHDPCENSGNKTAASLSKHFYPRFKHVRDVDVGTVSPELGVTAL